MKPAVISFSYTSFNAPSLIIFLGCGLCKSMIDLLSLLIKRTRTSDVLPLLLCSNSKDAKSLTNSSNVKSLGSLLNLFCQFIFCCHHDYFVCAMVTIFSYKQIGVDYFFVKTERTAEFSAVIKTNKMIIFFCILSEADVSVFRGVYSVGTSFLFNRVKSRV